MDIILLASTKHKNPYYYIDKVTRILNNSNYDSTITNTNRKVIYPKYLIIS